MTGSIIKKVAIKKQTLTLFFLIKYFFSFSSVTYKLYKEVYRVLWPIEFGHSLNALMGGLIEQDLNNRLI